MVHTRDRTRIKTEQTQVSSTLREEQRKAKRIKRENDKRRKNNIIRQANLRAYYVRCRTPKGMAAIRQCNMFINAWCQEQQAKSLTLPSHTVRFESGHEGISEIMQCAHYLKHMCHTTVGITYGVPESPPVYSYSDDESAGETTCSESDLIITDPAKEFDNL